MKDVNLKAFNHREQRVRWKFYVVIKLTAKLRRSFTLDSCIVPLTGHMAEICITLECVEEINAFSHRTTIGLLDAFPAYIIAKSNNGAR